MRASVLSICVAVAAAVAPSPAGAYAHADDELLDKALTLNETASALYSNISYKVIETVRTPDGKTRKVCEAQITMREGQIRGDLLWAPNDHRGEYQTYFLINGDYLLYWAPGTVNAHQYQRTPDGYAHMGGVYASLVRKYDMSSRVCGNGSETLRECRERLGARAVWSAAVLQETGKIEVMLRWQKSESYQKFVIEPEKGFVISESISGDGSKVEFRNRRELVKASQGVWFPATVEQTEYDEVSAAAAQTTIFTFIDVRFDPELDDSLFRRESLPIPDRHHIMVIHADGSIEDLQYADGKLLPAELVQEMGLSHEQAQVPPAGAMPVSASTGWRSRTALVLALCVIVFVIVTIVWRRASLRSK